MDGYYSLLKAGSQLENTLQRGRGEDSSVIITLPECSAFSDIPEEALAKVLTYLTLIPRRRQPGVKFIIILDRRLDTWSAIKTALARIAASFPGNLHLVLVLRPTSFFQRTVTDIGFRFSQEDFMLKMPVVMLSSVTDLLHYVDETQLTQEFGGSLEYSHGDWLVLRKAIENFAVTVKEIAQMLQAFGTELAETELPDEGKSIELLLMCHTDKYRKLKGEIRSVIREAHHLLSNLEASGLQEDLRNRWGLSQDWDTVQRLLAQLRDMEMVFDGFFDKHHLKLHQYLQLLRYEQSFQENRYSLDKLSAQEQALSGTADTLPKTEELIRALDTLESQAQDEMSRIQVTILHGHQLVASHHYALELIVQHCKELRHRCDRLSAALLTKRAKLSHTRDLLLELEEVLHWCDEGAYLLAGQLLEDFQVRESALAALKQLEKFLEGAPAPLSLQDLPAECQSFLTPPLQAQIEKAHKKLTSVQGLIGTRQASLKKLANRQTRPVQLVTPRPENPGRPKSALFSPKHGVDIKFTFDLSLPGKRTTRKSPTSRKIEVIHDYQENPSSGCSSPEGEDASDLLRRQVMKELVETERIYVDELLSVLLGYRAEMDNPALADLLPPTLRSKRDVLFGNMPEIYSFHSRLFLHDLERCLDSPEGVGACFLERKQHFQLYERYCQNKPCSESLWRQYSDCAFFQDCQRKLEHKLALDSYLLKPVQRLTKYQLLLKELLKCSMGCECAPELQGALAAMLELLKSVNDSMHQAAITGYEGELSQLGRLLMQGPFSVWPGRRRGPTPMKDLTRFKPMQRHLFLYEQALLFCKRREEHGESSQRTPSYSFKHCLKMSAVGITENIKGDVKKFEIWYSGREEVYVLQAPSVEIKMTWLTEIRRVLTNQQKLLTGSPVSERGQLSPPLSSSPLQRTSPSSEEAESCQASPVPVELAGSPPRRHRHRRSWPGASNSADVCEDLDEWSAASNLSVLSDTEEEDQGLLLPGRYRAQMDSQRSENQSLLVKSGDIIQLLQEDSEGWWLVKNLSRKLAGHLPVSHVHVILGLASRGQCSRLTDRGNVKVRKLSSP
ncbi:proto-oncogene DBL isoform X2 [Paramormyrops kingsleyae]|uniref:proto-oncogene DBL isoform X2 n=1 Tax=Paramormyrops kingsleyae TaxID=1676925 RepID=UPI003B96CDE9